MSQIKPDPPAGYMPDVKKKGIIYKLKQQYIFFLFIIPAFGLTLVFSYLPMVGLLMAFQDYSAPLGWFGSPFVGLKHFEAFLKDRVFFEVLRNTLIISFSLLIFTFPAPILLALCLDYIKSPKFKKISQTISYLPHFISWVVLAGLVYRILDPSTGIVNQVIMALGGEPVAFMRSGTGFYPLIVVVNLLKEVGWSSIVYLAAISAIDPELYDSAAIDGASRLKMNLHITLPEIAPTIATMLILRMGSFISVNFDMIFTMRNNMINSHANVLATFVYDKGILRNQFSYGSAVGLAQSAVTVILVVLSLQITRRMTGERIVV